MIFNEVNSYFQYLKLPSEFSYNSDSEGIFYAIYKHPKITVIGKGKSKKIAKEEACKLLKPHLQSFAKETFGSENVENKLKNIVKTIDKNIEYVQCDNDGNNIKVKCVVGEHETYGVATIFELAKIKSINSMLKIISQSVYCATEKFNWVDILDFLDLSFFKTLLHNICLKNSWILTFDSEKILTNRQYHTRCNIKSTKQNDFSLPSVEDITHTSESKSSGENFIAKEICLKYFRDYNDNINTLLKNQLEQYIKKFYDDEKLDYDIQQISFKPPIFQCFCKFSKLVTEGIHSKKKEAQGIAASKMFQKLCCKNFNNNLSNKKVTKIMPIMNSIKSIKDIVNSEEVDLSIDSNSIKNTILNYHSDLKNVSTKDYIIYKSNVTNYIFIFKYFFLIPDSDIQNCGRSFGVGPTKENAIQQGCCNLLTAITMKKSGTFQFW